MGAVLVRESKKLVLLGSVSGDCPGDVLSYRSHDAYEGGRFRRYYLDTHVVYLLDGFSASMFPTVEWSARQVSSTSGMESLFTRSPHIIYA